MGVLSIEVLRAVKGLRSCWYSMSSSLRGVTSLHDRLPSFTTTLLELCNYFLTDGFADTGTDRDGEATSESPSMNLSTFLSPVIQKQALLLSSGTLKNCSPMTSTNFRLRRGSFKLLSLASSSPMCSNPGNLAASRTAPDITLSHSIIDSRSLRVLLRI